MRSTFRPLRMETWVGATTPPAQRRSRHQFRASYSDTVHLLDREVATLGAQEFVIEADFKESDIRLDGMPRATAKQPTFPGVRIAFESRHGPLVYQSDSYDGWRENVRAIAKGLEALRAVDRYGITRRAEQYTGFRAIGSQAGNGATFFADADAALAWLRDPAVCGVVGADGLSLKTLLRHVARQVHPDRGGSRRDWDMYEEARRLLSLGGLL